MHDEKVMFPLLATMEGARKLSSTPKLDQLGECSIEVLYELQDERRNESNTTHGGLREESRRFMDN